MAGTLSDPAGRMIRIAGPDDVGLVAGILAAGFEDDPLMAWAFDDRRRAKLEALFGVACEQTYVVHGRTYLRDDGAAAWFPSPGKQEPNDARSALVGTALVEAGCTGDELDRLGAIGAAMDAMHPTEPHWYLGMVACLPDRRGRGIGSSLLERSLADVDAAGDPAYLESSNPRNEPLYERFGFVVTGTIDAHGGPPMTAMWRPAR